MYVFTFILFNKTQCPLSKTVWVLKESINKPRFNESRETNEPVDNLYFICSASINLKKVFTIANHVIPSFSIMVYMH